MSMEGILALKTQSQKRSNCETQHPGSGRGARVRTVVSFLNLVSSLQLLPLWF